MAAKKRKLDRYNILIAQNFLRNISLDGTHEDTGLRIFNRPGLPEDLFKKSQTILPASSVQVLPSSSGAQVVSPLKSSPSGSKKVSFTQLQPEEASNEELLQNIEPLSIDVCVNSPEKTSSLSSPIPEEERRDTLGNLTVAPPKFLFVPSKSLEENVLRSNTEPNLFSKRKTSAKSTRSEKKEKVHSKSSLDGLIHKLSVFWQSANAPISPPAGQKAAVSPNFRDSSVDARSHTSEDASLESSLGTSSFNLGKAEGLLSVLSKSLSIKPSQDRVCVVCSSNQVPLLIFSILASDQQKIHLQQPKRDSELFKTTNSTSTADISGLKPFELQEDEEVSYCRLLVPLGSEQTRRFLSEDPERKTRFLLSRASSVEPPSSPVFPLAAFAPDDNSDLEENEYWETDALARTFHFGGSVQSLLYDPHTLEDPDFAAGHHKTTLQLPSFTGTVLRYVDPVKLKKEMNEKCREKHSRIQITLSKIRSIKRELRRVALEAELELLTLAGAYVFFDKLILKGLVTKVNRKIVAGVCLILAAKLDDVKGVQLTYLFELLENQLRESRKDFLQFELPTVVALEFCLHLPEWEIFPHYQKLLWAR